MAAKLCLAVAILSLAALASGSQLRQNHIRPAVARIPIWEDIVQSLSQHDLGAVGDEELQEMEHSVEDLVTKGDDVVTKLGVKQLNHLIETTLIPAKERQLNSDTARLKSYAHELDRCHFDQQKKEDMNVHSKLAQAEKHQADYKDKRAKHGMCLEILDGKKMVKEAHCSSTEEEEVCHCDPKMVEFFGERNRDCDTAAKISSENQKCCEVYYEHERQAHHCETTQYDAEYAEKQHSIIMGKLCKDYDKCYDTRAKQYSDAEKLVKKKDHDQSWRRLFRIRCLIQEFDKGKVSKAAAQACKEKEYDEPFVKYPTVAQKEHCDTEVQQWVKVPAQPSEKIA